jgi:translation initiation factor IF-1
VFRRDAIVAEGLIVAVLPKGRFRVELANGHRLLAFARRRHHAAVTKWAIGDKVVVEVSPCDVSKGCLRVEPIEC